jgi:hypothetical protein
VLGILRTASRPLDNFRWVSSVHLASHALAGLGADYKAAGLEGLFARRGVAGRIGVSWEGATLI